MNNAIQNTVDSAKDVIQAAGDLANQAVDDFGNVVTDGTEVRFSYNIMFLFCTTTLSIGLSCLLRAAAK